MALKPDRSVIETDITCVCDTVAERGTFLVYKTGGLGTAMGENATAVELVSAPSGERVAGVLMNQVVAALNPGSFGYVADEVEVGGPVCLLKKGYIVTDKVTGTPAVGAPAYLGTSGVVSATQASGAPQVGEFAGTKDADGFIKVNVNLPA